MLTPDIAPLRSESPPQQVLRYGTCSQGISQFYLHSHTFIRNRNEPYLPLPSQPQLVLIYWPRRDGRPRRPWCEVAQAEIRTRNLLIANPALCYTATSAPLERNMTSLTFYNNYSSISCRFWDIQCRIMSWPLKVIGTDTCRWPMLIFRHWQQDAIKFAETSLKKSIKYIMLYPSSLAPPRNLQFTSRLRKSSIYPKPFNRTNRYKSFINYALTNYQ